MSWGIIGWYRAPLVTCGFASLRLLTWGVNRPYKADVGGSSPSAPTYFPRSADVARHETKLSALDDRLNDLAPTVLEWRGWERERSPDLDRLATLNVQIDLTQRLNGSSAAHYFRYTSRRWPTRTTWTTWTTRWSSNTS